MADEGSVFVDGVDPEIEDISEDTDTETNDEDVNNSGSSSEEQDKKPVDTEDKDEAEADSTDKPADEEQTKAEKTDKGTKLDSDPLSRANQMRANAEAEVRQYHALLNDPERLEAYIKELKKERGEADKTDEPEVNLDDLDPTKLETVEDLQKYALGLKQATAREIAAVKKQVFNLTSHQQEEQTDRRIEDSIQKVQTIYPELRKENSDGSKNPAYIKELDDLVAEMYTELDFDQKTKRFRGQVDLMKIADQVMKARTIGEGTGSRKAQTDVIDKRAGRISGTKTSTDNAQPDDSKLSPSATIAQRMKAAANAKR